MRHFTKKQSTLYTGTTGRQIRLIAKNSKAVCKDVFLLADYLLAGPAAEVYGLYILEPELVCVHLPLTVAEFRTAMTHLEDLDFAAYDDATRWVFVKEMAGKQLGAPLKPLDNQVRSAKQWYIGLSKGCPFLGAFYDRWVSDLCLDSNNDKSGPPVHRRPRPSEAPSEGPSLSLSQSPSLFPVEGGVGETELELVAPGPAPRPVLVESWRDVTFKEFWSVYPKPSGRKEAFQEWTEHIKTPEQATLVIEKLRVLLPFFNYESDGKFILDPCRWIKRHKWEDEAPRVPNMSGRTQSTAKAVAAAQRRGAPK